MRFLDHLQPLGLLVMRLALGAIMVGHGYPKLFGGMSQFVKMVSGLGLPGWLAYLSVAAEFLGGILLIAGLLTRLASLAVFVDMAVAIDKVHWKHGLLGENGYQFPLALAAIAMALIFFGAGPISLDWVFGKGSGIARK